MRLGHKRSRPVLRPRPILVAGRTVVGLELGALVREIIFGFGLSGELLGPTEAQPDAECGVVCVEAPDQKGRCQS